MRSDGCVPGHSVSAAFHQSAGRDGLRCSVCSPTSTSRSANTGETRTHTRTRARTRTHKHAHVYTHTRSHKHTCIHIQVQVTHMCTTHTHTHTCACMHTYWYTNSHTHTHTHTRTHLSAHVIENTTAQKKACAYTHSCIHNKPKEKKQLLVSSHRTKTSIETVFDAVHSLNN